MILSTALVSAPGAFEAWARVRQSQSAGQRRLSDKSVDGMRWHWKSWCDHLQALPLAWQEAQPSDVGRFLAGLQGSRVVARVVDPDGQARSLRRGASGVTRSRYARLLHDVYSHATMAGWVQRNPVEPWAITGERGDSLVFKGPLLHRLITAARERGGADWIEARDAALLLLMCQLGPTVGELRALTLADVQHPRLPASGPLRWTAQAELPGTAARSPVRLQLPASKRRPQLARSLELPQPARTALTRWLEIRLAQLPAAASRARTAPLFVSRKGFGPLTAKTLFLVANNHIRSTIGQAFSGALGELDLKHTGPATLRNSCIDAWLSVPGADPDDVAARSGLKDAASLARLRAGHAGRDAPESDAPGWHARDQRGDNSELEHP